MVLEGGLGVEKNLNVGGITTITDYLNVTDGHIAIEAGTSNEGYRIDSGNTIEMSLHKSTVSGTPIVLDVVDGKRLVLGANDNGLVEIRDEVNGTYRAKFTENEQVLYWNGSRRFQTYDSGVEITGFTTTTAGLMVGAAATITGNLVVDGDATLGDSAGDQLAVNAQILTDLIPAGTTMDLGGSSTRWRHLYLSGQAIVDGVIAGGFLEADNLALNRIPYTVAATTSGHSRLEDTNKLQFNNASGILTTVNGNLSGWLSIGSTASFKGNIEAVGGLTGDVTGDLTGNSTTATDLSINSTDRLLYQAGNNNTAVLPSGSSGQVLISQGNGGEPQWGTDITGNAGSADSVDVTANSTNANQFLLFKASSSTESGATIRVDAGAKYNPNSNQLTINGNIIAFASDDRLKTNKVEITNALDKVVSLSGFTYNFNETAAELGFNTDITYVGVSAQEVQKVLPEAVSPAPADEKYMTVQYEKIVPLLIEAIKELKAEVDQLKKLTR